MMGPLVSPVATAAPFKPMARPRSAVGNACVIIASEVDINIAAPTP